LHHCVYKSAQHNEVNVTLARDVITLSLCQSILDKEHTVFTWVYDIPASEMTPDFAVFSFQETTWNWCVFIRWHLLF
jgi:hypothetical protein